MDRFADDGKLGQKFTSADDLVEVDIGSGDRPRLTFISAKLDSECKQHNRHDPFSLSLLCFLSRALSYIGVHEFFCVNPT